MARAIHRPRSISKMGCVIHGHLFSKNDLPSSGQIDSLCNPKVRVAGMVNEIILAKSLISWISQPQILIHLHESTIIRLSRSNILSGEEGPTKHYRNFANPEGLCDKKTLPMN